ncbi:MAG: RNA polymerase sigma factor [Planctomycetota bacterium]
MFDLIDSSSSHTPTISAGGNSASFGSGAHAAVARITRKLPVAPADLPDLTPEQLVDQIAAGNTAAQAELLDRFGGLIHVVAVEYAPDGSQVEDLEQECRIHLLRQLPHYDPARPLKPWLMTVVRNCARNFRRSANRWRLIPLPDSSVYPLPSDDPAPGEVLGDAEMAAHLRSLVDDLPTIYRQVVERRYFSEHSCEQIATALRIPVGTVKNRLFRARQMLADRLERMVA